MMPGAARPFDAQGGKQDATGKNTGRQTAAVVHWSCGSAAGSLLQVIAALPAQRLDGRQHLLYHGQGHDERQCALPGCLRPQGPVALSDLRPGLVCGPHGISRRLSAGDRSLCRVSALVPTCGGSLCRAAVSCLDAAGRGGCRSGTGLCPRRQRGGILSAAAGLGPV